MHFNLKEYAHYFRLTFILSANKIYIYKAIFMLSLVVHAHAIVALSFPFPQLALALVEGKDCKVFYEYWVYHLISVVVRPNRFSLSGEHF